MVDDIDALGIAPEPADRGADTVRLTQHERPDQAGDLEAGRGIERAFVIAFREYDDALERTCPFLDGLAERDHVAESFRWSAVSTGGATNCAMSPPSDAISRTSEAER